MSGRRVLVTGSRDWTAWEIVWDALDSLQPIDTVIEGEARGVDTIARQWAEERQVRVEPYPALWDKYGKAAGPIRNQQMLDEGRPDTCLWVHDDLASSKGTWDMVKRARDAGLYVVGTGHWGLSIAGVPFPVGGEVGEITRTIPEQPSRYTVTGGATPRSAKVTWTVRKDGRATEFGYFDKALALAKRDELEAADRNIRIE